MIWVDYIQALAGIYMLVLALMMSTENFRSFFVFRLVPGGLAYCSHSPPSQGGAGGRFNCIHMAPMSALR